MIIYDYNRKIAIEFNVVGLMNIQYAIADDVVYILEANPRASRTVPLVSKVCGIPMVPIATQLMLGKRLSDMELERLSIPHFGVKEAVFPFNMLLERLSIPHFGVKEAVFPFNMFQEVDPLLGPEMRSTGEVLGMADSFGLAFYKAQEATQLPLPSEGTVLITLSEEDKPSALPVAKQFKDIGFKIKATKGTSQFLLSHGIESESVLKMHEGRPNILDSIKNGEIKLVVNTPSGKQSKHDDSYIRKAAIKYKIPYITTVAAAAATVKGIAAFQKNQGQVKSLQNYHADIKKAQVVGS
jgi:carbamoyl-phosphate synthase large subunit